MVNKIVLITFLFGMFCGFLVSIFHQQIFQGVESYSHMWVNVSLEPIEENIVLRKDDDSVARRLRDQVRVLVWVMTYPKTLQTRAKAVRDTWGKRCNRILFFSSEEDADFPAIGLNVTEGREHLTAKTMQAFQYIYKHHFDDADWFMKADDDTYLIVENLRYFLSGQNTSEPVYFGHRLNIGAYNSGGSGYVLSKESLRRFGLNSSSVCLQDGRHEDLEMGLCMESLGVRIGNTTDSAGRIRFYAFEFPRFLYGAIPHDPDLAKKGREQVSNYAISFHYIPHEMMLVTDLYLYHIRPYGIFHALQDLNRND